METWKAILIAFGGNAALIAILAFLAKLLFSEWLRRQSIDRQILHSKLHEKRTDAISSIYVGLNEYVSCCKKFIRQAMHVDENNRQELRRFLGKSLRS